MEVLSRLKYPNTPVKIVRFQGRSMNVGSVNDNIVVLFSEDGFITEITYDSYFALSQRTMEVRQHFANFDVQLPDTFNVHHLKMLTCHSTFSEVPCDTSLYMYAMNLINIDIMRNISKMKLNSIDIEDKRILENSSYIK